MPEAQKTRGMAIKMDKTTIIVSAVVGSLGVLSAVLGFSAEGTKLTPYTILVSDYDCIYPQNPALGLAICAVIFLLAAQVTVSAAGGCCGCCKSRAIPSETKRIIGIICAVVSWIAAVIAWALLIDGAAWNANVVRVAAAPYCPYLKDGVFAGAGVLALAATALGITSFIMLRSQPAPAAPATPTPGTSVTATPNWPGGQSPASVTGIPLLPAQHPSKLQATYVQVQQVPPTAASHPQQNGQAPQNLQVPAAAAAPPAPAAAQDNGSQHQQAPNQQFPPQGLVVAGAALPAAAYAPQELGVAMVQPPQVPRPQVSVPVPTDALQYSVPVPAAAAAPLVCGEIPAITAPAPATGPPQGTGLATVIRNQVAREGIKFAADMIRHNLLSNNTDTSTTLPGAGDGGILSMMTDSTGGDVQATN